METLIVIKEDELKELHKKLDQLFDKLEAKKTRDNASGQYLKTPAAAKYLGVDRQTIANFEDEGLITRYGRGKLHLYKIEELEKAIKIKENGVA